ncbi:MAG: hypothetical protein QRY16_21805, partial [Enterobacterales bacterium endosymbiont of Blomia tropicalis]|uniref:hypothetical protein n=1 Tax=Mixta mediterraneensis TaxID=2758443 RepID=UPI0025A85756
MGSLGRTIGFFSLPVPVRETLSLINRNLAKTSRGWKKGKCIEGGRGEEREEREHLLLLINKIFIFFVFYLLLLQ